MTNAISSTQQPPVLEVKSLTKFFGGLRAVHDFNMVLNHGDLAGLIGPNGAGKTTAFNLITGLYTPSSGDIVFENKSITGYEPFEITLKGISRTFQNIRLFPNLSVMDNVCIGFDPRGGYNLFDAILRNKKYETKEQDLTEKAVSYLEILHLENIRNELVKNLPYGEQRRVEIARAMACQPHLLLLDEPAAGMNPREIVQLMDLIHFIHDRFDLTILLIEHQMRVVMGICEHITVMDFGEVIARGNPNEIQQNDRVIEAYLGKGATHAA
jgi:branched-chain amino acid transport system ATP-binding protein